MIVLVMEQMLLDIAQSQSDNQESKQCKKNHLIRGISCKMWYNILLTMASISQKAKNIRGYKNFHQKHFVKL